MPKGPDKDRFEPRWPLITALVVLSGWVFILSLPMWTGAFLASPVSDQFGTGWAFRHWGAEQWNALGHVPLWNPEIMGGLPFVGALHGDVFYPTAWLRLFLSTTAAMNLGFVVHYILAGVFVYVFLRLLSLSWTAGVVGGFAYQLSGVIASYATPGHDGKLFVTTLLPVALIGLVLAFRKGRHEGFAILALATGLGLLSPHHQLFYYMMVASGIFAIYLAFGDPGGSPPRVGFTKLAGALAAVLVGIGVGAIQILPFFAYIPFSPRAETYRGFAGAVSYSIPWSHVPEFFLAGFVGSVQTYWGPNPLKLHSEYLGLAAIGLAALGVTAPERRRLILWVGAIGLLFLLVALGGSTPFYRLWWGVMPFMKKVRAPGMALFVVSLVVAVYAALGVERLERGAGKRAHAIWLIAGGGVAALALTGAIGAVAESIAQAIEMGSGRPATTTVRAAQESIRVGAFASGAALAAVGLLTWGFRTGKLKAPAFALLTILVISGDLWWNGRSFWRFTHDYEALHQPDAVTQRILSTERPYRVFDLPVPSTYPGSSLMGLEISQLLGHHGNELHRFDELLGGKNEWRNALSPALWDLYAVEWVIVSSNPAPIDSIPGFIRILTNQPTSAGTVADLYRRAKPARYARLVPAAIKVPDEQAIPALARGQVALDRLVLLAEDGRHDPTPVDALPPAFDVGVEILQWEPGRMRLRVVPAAPGPAYLLVSENWYPDWRADVDGVDTPVLRGDVSLLTVPVPAGAQEVELRFVSREYRRGRLLTWLSVGLVATGLVLPPVFRRRRRG